MSPEIDAATQRFETQTGKSHHLRSNLCRQFGGPKLGRPFLSATWIPFQLGQKLSSHCEAGEARHLALRGLSGTQVDQEGMGFYSTKSLA